MFTGWFQGGNSSAAYQPVRSSSESDDGADELSIDVPDGPDTTTTADSTAATSTSSSLPIAVSASFAKMKGFLGIVPELPPEEKTFTQELDEMTTLTRTQRLYGFGIVFVIGQLISLMSLFAVGQILLHPEKFALLYTFGNILSICSSFFLWGPWKQLKDMFKPVRMIATIVYIASMILTFFCAFGLHMMIPTLISIGIQFCAMVWYCASYIPYGHEMISGCLKSCWGVCFK